MTTKSVAIIEPFGNAALTLAQAVKAEGYDLISVTQQDVLPALDAEVVSLSSSIELVSFSAESVVDDIISSLSGKDVVAVITGWEFFSGLVAEVCERLGLPGNDPSRSAMARNKWQMAIGLRASGVKHARTVVGEDAKSLNDAIVAAGLGWPLVIKPVENAGSVGVSIVDSFDLIEAAVTEAQAFPLEFPHGFPLDNRVIAQEYVGGREFSIESVAWRGEIRHVAITEKITTNGSKRAELGHVIPAQLDSHEASVIEKEVHLALKAMGFRNGVSHAEVKLWNGEAWIIEAGLRPGGDHIIKLVPLATGIDFAAAYVQSASDVAPNLAPTLNRAAGVQFLTPDRSGTAMIKSSFPSITGLVEGGFLVADGDSVTAGVDNISRLAYAILAKDDRSELDQAALDLFSKLDVEVV